MAIIQRTRVGIIGMVLAAVLLGAAQGYPASAKIDPALFMMLQPGADLAAAKARGIVQSVQGGREPLIKTVLRFSGDVSGIEGRGGKIGSIAGDVATVDIPLHAVDQIAQLPNVIYVEAARRLRPRLDVSVPATGANTLRSGTPPIWTGNTGRNVIVGIVDTGIDLHHRDFKDQSGNTRILSLLDQTNGTECTNMAIDAGSCPETDTDGHGTHVSGIAAGNGSGTGNGQPAYRYIGMAPEAELIIVKTDFTTSGILNGISYIQAKAAALGKPSVINLSLGSDLGPHDGTSNYELGLDNASGAGKVIVGAAGNEANANIHASGAVASSGMTTVGFTLPAGDTFEQLDIWYAGSDQMGISLSSGTSNCTTSVVTPGPTPPAFDTPCGKITIVSSLNNPNNGDKEIMVTLANGSHTLTAGAWTFTLSGINITNGRFDGWFEFGGDPANNAHFTTNIDPSITLIDTSTATETISVAAYNTKNTWNSLAGPGISYLGTVTIGDIADFSSLGPRRSCSDTANCPAVQKPEITAPGQGIMSTLSAQAISQDPHITDPDGVHVIDQGTSMAAPHVTGAVALLLQADPTLTSGDIKTILQSHSTADSFTGRPLPNDTWGFGKLDAAAAFNATPNFAPSAPVGFAATSANGAITLGWTANTELDLDGYNLYRNTSSGSGFAKVNSSLLSFKINSYVDSGLIAGTTYFYELTAVDTAGHESPGSTQASATVSQNPAPAAPVGLTALSGIDSITLNWTANTEPDLAGYNLYRSTTPSIGYAKVNSSLLPKTTTSYADSGLAGGTTYFYVLRAVDTAGQESGNSAQVSATAGGSPPSGGGGGGGGGGCFIATAAYGSYLDPHVQTLREFRDNVLLRSEYGRTFVDLYYAWSPLVADVIAPHPALRFITRLALTPLVLAVESPGYAVLLLLFVLFAVRASIMKRRTCSQKRG